MSGQGTLVTNIGTCRRLAQNLVGLTKLAVLAFQSLHLLGHLAWQPGSLASIDFRLIDPLIDDRKPAAPTERGLKLI